MTVHDLDLGRLQRDVDELRAELAALAHRVNQMVLSLQDQINDRVVAEAKFQP
jgi:HAMP domain-containing protein